MSKLHIPGSDPSRPLCGRQLNNHRDSRAQLSDKVTIAGSYEEYLNGLGNGKACRHCGRVAGLVPKLVRRVREQEVDDEGDSDE